MEIMQPPSYVDGYEIHETNLSENGMLNEFYDKAYDTAPNPYVCIRMATMKTKDLGDGWNVSLLDPVKPTYKAEYFVILHKPLEHNSTQKVWRLTGYKRNMGDPLQYFNPVIESKTDGLAASKSLTKPKKENVMNKSQLIAKIATDAGLTKVQATAALQAVEVGIIEALVNGDEVTMVGFGTFKVTERKAKKGRNPATGEAIQIPAKKAPIFKAGKAFKDAVN